MPVPLEIRQQVSAQILDNVAIGVTTRMRVCSALNYSLQRLSNRLGTSTRPGTHKWKYHEIIKLNHEGITAIDLSELD